MDNSFESFVNEMEMPYNPKHRVTLRTRKNVKPVAVNALLKEWQEEILKREIDPYGEKKKNE